MLGNPNDRFHHIWEAAATAATLVEHVVNLRRHDELPRIDVKQRDDGRLNFLFRYDVAMANKHVTSPFP